MYRGAGTPGLLALPNSARPRSENDGTGVYCYRARYYAPTWGRFISEDPIPLPNQTYSYADDNPVRYTDPSGEFPIGIVIGGIIGGILFAPTPTDVPHSFSSEATNSLLGTATGAGIASGLCSVCSSEAALANDIATGFTEHGLQRALERGISQAAIDNAILNNIGASASLGRYGAVVKFFGRNGITVVVSASGKNAGKIISVFCR